MRPPLRCSCGKPGAYPYRTPDGTDHAWCLECTPRTQARPVAGGYPSVRRCPCCRRMAKRFAGLRQAAASDADPADILSALRRYLMSGTGACDVAARLAQDP